MRIQHNIMAMNAYRNYNTNTKALSGNLEKLSSGYKINRAGDDAAGLAISEKMRAQITGLDAAQKNVKDGISLVKTAEGAMQEIQDMLNRMDYLATQSANGTYDNEVDRANLQKEVDALKTEINRIADSANFNGIKLLDGSLDPSVETKDEQDLSANTSAFKIIADGQLGLTEQAGAFKLDFTNFIGKTTGGDEVTVSLFGQDIKILESDATTDDDGNPITVTGQTIAATMADFINTDDTFQQAFMSEYGIKFTAVADGETVTLTMDKAPSDVWNVKSDFKISGIEESNKGAVSGNQAHTVQVSTVQEPVDSKAGRLYAQASLDLTKLTIEDGSTLTIGDTTYTFAVGKGSAYKSSDNVIDLTDMDTLNMSDKPTAGKVASRITTAAQSNKNFKVTALSPLDKNADGKIYLTEKEGGVDTENYKLQGTDNTKNAKDGDWSGLLKFAMADPDNMGTALTLQIGDTSDDYNQMKVKVGDMHTEAMGIDGINIGNQSDAAAAVQTIRDAINYVSGIRGDLGAIQNRLEHTGNNLSVMAENIQDAESTIRDTDVADEMMKYVKNNILVQSAQAMLAQANQVPQGVLQLLG